MTLHEDSQALAQRYARPLFEQARDTDTLTATAEGLRLLAALYDQTPSLQAFLAHPATALADKQAVIEADLTPHLQPVAPLVATLLRLLTENARTALIPEIARAFEALASDARQEGVAWVSSAVPLNDSQRQRLQAAICQRWGFQRATLHEHLDATLLGGLVVRVADALVDGSFAGRLAQLERLVC